MNRATVYLDVAGSGRLPLWAERRIRTRAQAEAERMARELETDVALVAHAGTDAHGRIVVGICDRLYRVSRDGLEPMRSPSVRNCGDISPQTPEGSPR